MLVPEPSHDSPFSVLRERSFALYWVGQAISFTGTWMQQVAQAWAILSLSSGAAALGTVNFIGALPPALLILTGGVVADRFDRRIIILANQVLCMVSAFTLGLLVKYDALELWHIYTAVFLIGVAFGFDLPATQAFVAELVPREKIGAAVQLNQVIFHGSRLVGPALAGLVVARFGTYSAFLANGLSFIPVILTLLVIRPQRQIERQVPQGTVQALAEAWRYVRARRDLMALLGITATVIATAFTNMVVCMPFYVKEVLGGDAGALGVMMSVGGGAAFLGAMSLLAVSPARRVGRIRLALAGCVLGLLALALAPRAAAAFDGPPALRLLLPGAAAFLTGFAVASCLGLVSVSLQQAAPDQMRGRITSLQGLVFLGVLPFSSLLVTRVCDAVTMPVELLASAAVAAGASLVCSRYLTPLPAAPDRS